MDPCGPVWTSSGRPQMSVHLLYLQGKREKLHLTCFGSEVHLLFVTHTETNSPDDRRADRRFTANTTCLSLSLSLYLYLSVSLSVCFSLCLTLCVTFQESSSSAICVLSIMRFSLRDTHFQDYCPTCFLSTPFHSKTPINLSCLHSHTHTHTHTLAQFKGWCPPGGRSSLTLDLSQDSTLLPASGPHFMLGDCLSSHTHIDKQKHTSMQKHIYVFKSCWLDWCSMSKVAATHYKKVGGVSAKEQRFNLIIKGSVVCCADERCDSRLEACCGTHVPGCGGTDVARGSAAVSHVCDGRLCEHIWLECFFISVGSFSADSQNTFFKMKLQAWKNYINRAAVLLGTASGTQIQSSATEIYSTCLWGCVVVLSCMMLRVVSNILSTMFTHTGLSVEKYSPN